MKKILLFVLMAAVRVFGATDTIVTFANNGTSAVPIMVYHCINGDFGNSSYNFSYTLAPGASYDYNFGSIGASMYGANRATTYSITAYTNGTWGTENTIGVPIPGEGGNAVAGHYYMNFGGEPAQCWTNVTFTVKNNDAIPHIYYIDNNTFHIVGGCTPMSVAEPGQTVTLSKTIPCDDVNSVNRPLTLKRLTSLDNVDDSSVTMDGEGQVLCQKDKGGMPFEGQDTGAPAHGTPAAGNDGSSNSNGVPPHPVAPSVTPTLDQPGTPTTGNPGSLSNILFTSSSADAAGTIAAIKDSAKVLYDVAVKAEMQAHADAAAIAAAVGKISVVVTNANGQLQTNYASESTLRQLLATNGATAAVLENVRQTFENLTDVTNMDVASEKTLAGMSNLMAQHWFSVTNQETGTNLDVQVGISNLITFLQTNGNNMYGSNLVLVGSNILNGMNTNARVIADAFNAGMTNIYDLISNNIASRTNRGAGRTNYATESTLSGISNTLAGISNHLAATRDFDTNQLSGQRGSGVAAAAEGSNALSGLSWGVNLLPADRIGIPLDGSWSFHIKYGRGYDIDLNPWHQAWVNAICEFMRKALTWILVVGVITVNSVVLLYALGSQGANRQATAASNIAVVSSGTALAMAGVITAVLVMLPWFAVGYFGEYLSFMKSGPFSGTAGGVVGNAVWMLDQWFPCAVASACMVARFTFNMSLGAVVWSCQTITRFLVG